MFNAPLRQVSSFAAGFVVIASLSLAAPARAQSSEAVGIRAQGMGGAFTAVADDASATWWNPAGLAGGAFGNAIVEYGTRQQPKDERGPGGAPLAAQRTDTSSFAAAFPAFGVSYYRLRVSQMQPLTSTGAGAAGRQDTGTVDVREQSLVLNQFGATIGQSIGQHFVIGSTLKIVQGELGTSVQPGSLASLDQAAELSGSGETHAGVDLGAMASFGRMRLGVMVRNVNELEFDAGAVTLKRQARVGAAFSSGRRGVIGSATLAVDADLTTSPGIIGDERKLAVGGEIWVASQRIGLRGGVSGNTIGPSRTAVSGGLSAMLLKHTFVDAQLTGGSEAGPHGWGLDARVTF